VLASVRLGGDPLAERAALRGAVTLREAWARYLGPIFVKRSAALRQFQQCETTLSGCWQTGSRNGSQS
jgi:hypothetical protein